MCEWERERDVSRLMAMHRAKGKLCSSGHKSLWSRQRAHEISNFRWRRARILIFTRVAQLTICSGLRLWFLAQLSYRGTTKSGAMGNKILLILFFSFLLICLSFSSIIFNFEVSCQSKTKAAAVELFFHGTPSREREQYVSPICKSSGCRERMQLKRMGELMNAIQ